MDNVIVIASLIFILPLLAIIIVLSIIQKVRTAKYKKIINKLEYEKNVINSTPINSELSKIEAFLKNEKIHELYNEWVERFEELTTKKMPEITDMILNVEYCLNKKDHKSCEYKIAKLEIEVNTAKTYSEELLEEIKQITTSDEKNRSLITELKVKYRKLYEEFISKPEDYGEIFKYINLQFENIAHRFEAFEKAMEQKEFVEIAQIINSIDEMLKHMQYVIEEIPSVILLTVNVLPQKICEIKRIYHDLLKKGYQLDYLNVEYNIEESEKKITDIISRSKVLNLEDSTFELKVINDYLDSLYEDFEKEKLSYSEYEKEREEFSKRLDKKTKEVFDFISQIEELKKIYNLSDEKQESLLRIKTEMDELSNDYKSLLVHTSNNVFAYSKLTSEIKNLANKLNMIEESLDLTLEAIGNMKEDEVRAREQLEEIKLILEDAKKEISLYNLPIIPKAYETEYYEATDSIKEIIKELRNQPIMIETLNTRVDTARDLTLKLLKRAKEITTFAKLSENAIVYSNRFRSSYTGLDEILNYSENLFFTGEYRKSYNLTLGYLRRIEPNLKTSIFN